MSGTPSPEKPENLTIRVAFDEVRSRLFLFGCGVSLVRAG
jgi:hypothetical protein